MATAERTRPRRTWPVPAGLLALAAIPVLAGSLRLAELAGDPAVTADNARFVTDPVPVSVHIAGATVFTVVGVAQFVPGLRRRRPGLHRAAGRVLVPAGLAAALSGVWMMVFSELPPSDDALLGAVRVVVGAGMAAALVAGVVAVRRGDITRHRAWMTRAYALGAGAGTQAVLMVPWTVLAGAPTGPAKTAAMTAAWVINLVVAERALRRA